VLNILVLTVLALHTTVVSVALTVAYTAVIDELFTVYEFKRLNLLIAFALTVLELIVLTLTVELVDK
jgi:hypothetical protein